jgi:hypothetical protein
MPSAFLKQAINSAMCIDIYHIARACTRAASKQCLLYKTNKYFHINKNNTGYHKACFSKILQFFKIIFKLCSTTEQMPALVFRIKYIELPAKVSFQRKLFNLFVFATVSEFTLRY